VKRQKQAIEFYPRNGTPALDRARQRLHGTSAARRSPSGTRIGCGGHVAGRR
jgi:hypothetical protein